MVVTYHENSITVTEFNDLREAVGGRENYMRKRKLRLNIRSTQLSHWMEMGMARIVGDGVAYWCILDVAALTEFHSENIGSMLVGKNNGLCEVLPYS